MITAAAIKRDGIIYTGKRHGEIGKDMIMNHGVNPPILIIEQGFIDENGSFFGRDQSLDLAYESGQIKVTESGNFDIIGGVLTSEDLW